MSDLYFSPPLSAGDHLEMVCIHLIFEDNSSARTELMTRYKANLALREIGELGTPIGGKHVKWALIVKD